VRTGGSRWSIATRTCHHSTPHGASLDDDVGSAVLSNNISDDNFPKRIPDIMSNQLQAVELVEYDSKTSSRNGKSMKSENGLRKVMKWDTSSPRFSYSVVEEQFSMGQVPMSASSRNQDKLRAFMFQHFMPRGNITGDYYIYTKWRAIQRLIASTSSVFGTQALVMALGVRSGKGLGIAAATAWVLKDALGKLSRILWASRFGARFDTDAKKWRFRSSILYASGSALEILTYLTPNFFIYTAAAANALKQMSMLTSSATRNAIYRSFARNSDNIGDVTAKGEAQIAIVDLVGMFVGIGLSRITNASRKRLVCTFVVLSILDLTCLFQEIKSVVFNRLNFERGEVVFKKMFDQMLTEKEKDSSLEYVTPEEAARKEKIFLPAKVAESLFVSWSKLQVNTDVLSKSMNIFKFNADPSVAVEGEESGKVMVTLDVSIPSNPFALLRHKLFQLWTKPKGYIQGFVDEKGNVIPVVLTPQALLHRQGTPRDIFRALLVVHYILHQYERESCPFDWKQCFKYGLRQAVTKIDNDDNSENVFLEKNRLHADGLLNRLQQGKDFLKEEEGCIEGLQNVGWDVTKCIQSNIRNRVDFGA
jgi:hypothetical protein